MMRLLFGTLLGLLSAFPAFLGMVAAVLIHPVVLAVLVGVLTWPHVARTLRRWAT